jgi:hypothetical protein
MFTIHRDKEPVHTFGGSYRVPDPDWHYVDAAGHEHTYGAGTFKTVNVFNGYWEGGDEDWSSHQECVQCGEWIVPGTLLRHGPMFIHGPSRFYVDGVEVTEDEFNRQRKEALDEAR